MKNTIKNPNKKGNKLAVYLAYAGTIPFIFSALYICLIETIDILKVSNAIIIYSYIILTFIGSIYWGLALNTINTNNALKYYSFSVTPALICWFVYLLNLVNLVNIVLIILLLNLFFLLEKKLLKNNKKLNWYLLLRFKLNCIVTSSLLVLFTINFFY